MGKINLLPSGRRFLRAAKRVLGSFRCWCCGTPTLPPPCDCGAIAVGPGGGPNVCAGYCACQPAVIDVVLSGFDGCHANGAGSVNGLGVDGVWSGNASSPDAGGICGWESLGAFGSPPASVVRYTTNTTCTPPGVDNPAVQFAVDLTGGNVQVAVYAVVSGTRIYLFGGSTPWVDCGVGRVYTFSNNGYVDSGGVSRTGIVPGASVSITLCPGGT